MGVEGSIGIEIMIDFNDVKDLKSLGFIGFKTIGELWKDKSCIPKVIGIYMVLNKVNNPGFLFPGEGGFFDGKDPNVSLDELELNYVDNSLVIYIGKAGNLSGQVTLRSRISKYLRFGQGKNASHWGGRYIWQLRNYMNLVFCWKPTPDSDPREIEKSLLKQYFNQFGRRPFANLVD